MEITIPMIQQWFEGEETQFKTVHFRWFVTKNWVPKRNY